MGLQSNISAVRCHWSALFSVLWESAAFQPASLQTVSLRSQDLGTLQDVQSSIGAMCWHWSPVLLMLLKKNGHHSKRRGKYQKIDCESNAGLTLVLALSVATKKNIGALGSLFKLFIMPNGIHCIRGSEVLSPCEVLKMQGGLTTLCSRLHMRDNCLVWGTRRTKLAENTSRAGWVPKL